MDMGTSTMATATATGTAAAASATSTGMSMGGSSSSCKISMLWNWNIIDSCFIARSWHITSKGMFAGSCIGVVLLVMSLEFLRRSVKEWDRYLIKQHDAKYRGVSASENGSESGKDTIMASGNACQPIPAFRPNVWQQAIRALLHMMQFAVAYFVMLRRKLREGADTPTNAYGLCYNRLGTTESETQSARDFYLPATMRVAPEAKVLVDSAFGREAVEKLCGHRLAAQLTTAKCSSLRVLFAPQFLSVLAMYYNGYIIICIFIGAFLGSFIFHWEHLTAAGTGSTSATKEATVCCG
ncbi:ctr copper transporter family protein [Zalerion maritima]|uniref:Copper transport protein n=1 Tax=Zalerion maritima TaxID=339359 RepID=A0AAD5RT47_9PEZI|nr:ctr copper transporter family protein [Zalerion maritima]